MLETSGLRVLRAAVLLAFLATPSLVGQGLTGALGGVVTHDGAPLAGVEVTIASPALQGERTTVTNSAGGFRFSALPPGGYVVRFEAEGMKTSTRKVHVAVAQAARLEHEMRGANVVEAITVTAAAPIINESSEVQTFFGAEVIDSLPVPRTILGATSLAPGTVQGINGLAISGATSHDNLYTINGANVVENVRGQPHNLFIEDAIQETTIQTGGVSAEFGNFTGGVVNAITRSGGNELSGSLRDSMRNPAWTARTPFRDPVTGEPQQKRFDDLTQAFEATLGGRIVHDRLWFFAAGRYEDRTFEQQFVNSSRTFIRGDRDQRLEAKLTGTVGPRHTIVGSYLDAPRVRTNDCQIGCIDESSLDPRNEVPSSFATIFYNSVLTNTFVVEGKLSRKDFTFRGAGGEERNVVTGTPVRFAAPGWAGVANEPYFCGRCSDEQRDNDGLSLKATYYLGMGRGGSHSISGGAERWHERRVANNFQSPTNFVFVARTVAPWREDNETRMSIIGGRDYVQYWPVLRASNGSDLETLSFYVNDKWDVSGRWQLTLGARFDRNDATDSAGAQVAADSKLSPRLGATFDVLGNGRLRLNATYGVYAGRLAETVAGLGSAAGNPARIDYLYEGPDIIDATPQEALEQFFAWFQSNGCMCRKPIAQSVPGFNRRIDGDLNSPSVTEWTLGIGTRGARGIFRADYIRRAWSDFYGINVTQQTGMVERTGYRADVELIGNANDLARRYEAIELQGQYRFFDRINIGGNYTLSRLTGNVTGETATSGPIPTPTGSYYPEYHRFARNNPVGLLEQDQTHKLRAWSGFDMNVLGGTLGFMVLQSFDSGRPYSLVGTIDVRASGDFYGQNQPGGVRNPGYVSAPTEVAYYFSERGQFRFDDVTSTDLALHYSFALGRVLFFTEVDVLNIFNEMTLVSYDTSIVTAAQDTTLQRFNPIAGDQPIEGVHWRKAPLFGKATRATTLDVAGDYQLPRTYRVSFGLRF